MDTFKNNYRCRHCGGTVPIPHQCGKPYVPDLSQECLGEDVGATEKMNVDHPNTDPEEGWFNQEKNMGIEKLKEDARQEFSAWLNNSSGDSFGMERWLDKYVDLAFKEGL